MVCSCAICHASASVKIPYGTQKKYCCTGSLAQIRALTRDGPLDKVNGILVPRTLFSLRSTVSNTKDTREVLAAPEKKRKQIATSYKDNESTLVH